MERLKELFKKAFPNLTITLVAEYSDKYFLIEAMEDPNAKDVSDPYFLLNKETLEVFPFMPLMDLDVFSDALDKRVLWKMGDEE